MCAWCGAPGKIIEEKTPLERTDFEKLLKDMKGENERM
jgi:hypothetical protein